MKHRTLSDLGPAAQIVTFGSSPSRAVRRERLERLALLLEKHNGPIRLLSGIEYLSGQDRRMLRRDNSALAIAYHDPVLRGQGLASDRLGDAVDFFDLSEREAHLLLCDCHYAGRVPPTPAMLAVRARAFADRRNLRGLWNRLRDAVTVWR